MNAIYTDILNIIYNDMKMKKNDVDGKNSDTNDK